MASRPDISLADRYEKTSGEAYVTGNQALVLSCLLRRRLDEARGLRTAGFVSGYRGSPVGTLDNDFWAAESYLDAHNIVFQPGINEELAATAVWGTQQVHLLGGSDYEGVFGLWYAKGAGLDRCGDVMRHAHGAGTSPLGGVLAVVGDDHTLKSSSQAYHSEPFFMDMLMPVLYPANIQEMIQYAVLGWELSRFSGCWVGLKVLAENVNSTTSVQLDMPGTGYHFPDELPFADQRHIRWPDPWADVEHRLHQSKLPAALAFARANAVDRVVVLSPQPRLGIVTTGKSYLDVLEALRILNLTPSDAAQLGVSLFKVGMPWPLEPQGISTFAATHPQILIVEEKRGFLESQLKDLVYNAPTETRPAVIGRHDERGAPLFSNIQENSPEQIALILAERLDIQDVEVKARLDLMQRKLAPSAAPIATRDPYFCSGCPHNTSTKVPDGSQALAGVGCHYMAVGMDRDTSTFTQMGGEGVTWIGAAPFSDTDHVFVNLGEGTYFHSGSLAIRASVAAKVNVTYKILYNDAVAMTGGQPVDGTLTVPDIVAQLRAEGVERVEVVTDRTDRYAALPLPPGTPVHHRDDLNQVQKSLRAFKGVSVLIYDQECATEKRRRRKRGQMDDPKKRIFINDLVCEGCGDCSAVSNCLSVIPKETEFGRKRQIDQSACNKDYSCVKGFCPSFVAVIGGELDKSPRQATELPLDALPAPETASIEAAGTYNIFVTGVGGGGVITIGALLGMAALLEGKAFVVHDRLGMAQKFGGVTSHVRIAESAGDIHAARIPSASADLLLGGDLHVTGLPSSLALVDARRTHALVNTNQTVTGEFPRNPGFDFQKTALLERISSAFDAPVARVPATDIALALTGDAIGANMFMLGFALQKGWLPVKLESLERAIELNGVAVDANKRALAIGRFGAAYPDRLAAVISPPTDDRPFPPRTLEEVIAHRSSFLIDYQDEAYAERYRASVRRVSEAEERIRGAPGALTMAVAKNLFKLMAYKDEYEVARLHAETGFQDEISRRIKGKYQLRIYMAPPLLSRRDPETGALRKREFGPWMMTAMKYLARLKWLRGTRFDPFGYTEERRQERALVRDYETLLETLVSKLSPGNIDVAEQLTCIPDSIRGYGHIKQRNLLTAKSQEAGLLRRFENLSQSVSL